ncbi:MAG: hypothetical protein HYX59_12875 [Elusimicrobia bacterium]|nr:hypothetical protein [Elusimicrobiota bacterium]
MMNLRPGAPFGQQPLPGPRDPLWERTFSHEDLACFERRGGRLSQAEWLKFVGSEGPVVAYYERVTGVPFCRADFKPMCRALALTNGLKVLRAIRDAARNPAEHPGFFLIKQGFASVTGLIERRPDLQSRAKLRKGERPASPAGSSRSENVNRAIREQMEQLARGGTERQARETQQPIHDTDSDPETE